MRAIEAEAGKLATTLQSFILVLETFLLLITSSMYIKAQTVHYVRNQTNYELGMLQ